MNLLNKTIIAASPVLGACALYYLFGLLGLVPWMKLVLSASIAIAAASFAQAATTASMARVRFWRSHAIGRFARDAALAFSLSIPISVGLHARFIYLTTGTLSAVFSSPEWDTWLTVGRGWATWFSVFVMCMGVFSLARLVITRMNIGDNDW
jgi:hypothetical protein